jgi:hypothetical protein
MEKKYTPLHIDEVIHVKTSANPLRQLIPAETYKVKALLENIEKRLLKALIEGVDCEVMRLDQPGWQKGEIRIKQIELEFCPAPEESDQAESPLDEFRSPVI